MKKSVMILGVIGCCVFLLCFYFFFPKEEKREEIYEDLSITDAVVQKLYDMANPSTSATTMLEVYKKEAFSNEYILGSAFVTLLKENPNHTDSITEEELNLYINKIFGGVTYAHSSGYIISPLLCNFKYDKTSRAYTITKGCHDENNTEIRKKLVTAKKSDTEYILTEKVILVKNNVEEVKKKEEQIATIKVYGDVFENKILHEYTYDIESVSMPVIKIEDFLSDAATYEYHFVFDGNSFVYKNIKKVG